MTMAERIHGIFGIGLAYAFFASCVGIDGPGQAILFCFGLIYGGLDRA